jgi:hypothetical protein
MSSTKFQGMDERIIESWSRTPIDERPSRVSVEDIVSTMKEFISSMEDYNNTDTAYSRVCVMVLNSLERLGFKRKLFEDGWFYIPPAKFSLLRVLKNPSKEDVLEAKKEMESASKNKTYVYFIQSVNGGPIKIGKSDDVKRRILDMQTANPFRLRLLLVLSDDKATEKEMHDAFIDLRIDGGEWFRPETELLDFIEYHIFRSCA